MFWRYWLRNGFHRGQHTCPLLVRLFGTLSLTESMTNLSVNSFKRRLKTYCFSLFTSSWYVFILRVRFSICFLQRAALLRAVLASISVCPSVTRRYCVKTNERRMISQPTLLTSGQYSRLRKLLVLWTCPSTSVIHIHNRSSHFVCLYVCIHVCCIITKLGLVAFNVRITVSAIYLA